MDEMNKLFDIEGNAKPLGEGVEAVVYALDDERVIRVYNSGHEPEKSKLESLQAFYNSLDGSHVSFEVPEIVSVDINEGTVKTIDKRLHGKNFGEIYETLDPETKNKTLISYLAASQEIRQLTPTYPYFGEVLADNPVREQTWAEFLSRKIDVAYEQGKEAFNQDVPEIQRVVDFMKSQLPLFDDVKDANLVHGDFYVSNVLVENDEVRAVVDFNDLTLAGDFRMDVVSAVTYLGDDGTGARDSDRELLINKLVSQYGERIKDVIHFYELYYALIFASYTKESDPPTYQRAIATLRQHAATKV